jgi:DNA-binding NtrC family response regulator
MPASGAAKRAGGGSSEDGVGDHRTAGQVLMVSGDGNLRTLMRSFLEQAEFSVVSCGDAARGALACTMGLKPDLLLVDLHTLGEPVMGLALNLSANRSGLPVVVLHGANSDARLLRMAERRRWKLLAKPVLVSDLLSAICTAIDSGRSNAQETATTQAAGF